MRRVCASPISGRPQDGLDNDDATVSCGILRDSFCPSADVQRQRRPCANAENADAARRDVDGDDAIESGMREKLTVFKKKGSKLDV